ncbi:hypothetical protein C8R45DRAFT_162903 [Mycena sanguinolenta]|nr:hypothetical protein C8R45DRAFT_162903 [Mycena sanguinolenta]
MTAVISLRNRVSRVRTRSFRPPLVVRTYASSCRTTLIHLPPGVMRRRAHPADGSTFTPLLRHPQLTPSAPLIVPRPRRRRMAFSTSLPLRSSVTRTRSARDEFESCRWYLPRYPGLAQIPPSISASRLPPCEGQFIGTGPLGIKCTMVNSYSAPCLLLASYLIYGCSCTFDLGSSCPPCSVPPESRTVRHNLTSIHQPPL